MLRSIHCAWAAKATQALEIMRRFALALLRRQAILAMTSKLLCAATGRRQPSARPWRSWRSCTRHSLPQDPARRGLQHSLRPALALVHAAGSAVRERSLVAAATEQEKSQSGTEQLWSAFQRADKLANARLCRYLWTAQAFAGHVLPCVSQAGACMHRWPAHCCWTEQGW